MDTWSSERIFTRMNNESIVDVNTSNCVIDYKAGIYDTIKDAKVRITSLNTFKAKLSHPVRLIEAGLTVMVCRQRNNKLNRLINSSLDHYIEDSDYDEEYEEQLRTAMIAKIRKIKRYMEKHPCTR